MSALFFLYQILRIVLVSSSLISWPLKECFLSCVNTLVVTRNLVRHSVSQVNILLNIVSALVSYTCPVSGEGGLCCVSKMQSFLTLFIFTSQSHPIIFGRSIISKTWNGWTFFLANSPSFHGFNYEVDKCTELS